MNFDFTHNMNMKLNFNNETNTLNNNSFIIIQVFNSLYLYQ